MQTASNDNGLTLSRLHYSVCRHGNGSTVCACVWSAELCFHFLVPHVDTKYTHTMRVWRKCVCRSIHLLSKLRAIECHAFHFHFVFILFFAQLRFAHKSNSVDEMVTAAIAWEPERPKRGKLSSIVNYSWIDVVRILVWWLYFVPHPLPAEN